MHRTRVGSLPYYYYQDYKTIFFFRTREQHTCQSREREAEFDEIFAGKKDSYPPLFQQCFQEAGTVFDKHQQLLIAWCSHRAVRRLGSGLRG